MNSGSRPRSIRSKHPTSTSINSPVRWPCSKREVLTIRKGAIKVPGALDPRSTCRTGDDNTLTHLLVSFQRGMVGDMNKRTVQFEQNVETVYTPRRRLARSVDHRDDRSAGTRGTRRTRHSHDQRHNASRAGHSTAGWRTVLRVDLRREHPRRWSASSPRRAHRITYTSAKDMLVVKGDGRADAELWYKQKGTANSALLPALVKFTSGRRPTPSKSKAAATARSSCSNWGVNRGPIGKGNLRQPICSVG